jgi:hypothetical protein
MKDDLRSHFDFLVQSGFLKTQTSPLGVKKILLILSQILEEVLCFPDAFESRKSLAFFPGMD